MVDSAAPPLVADDDESERRLVTPAKAGGGDHALGSAARPDDAEAGAGRRPAGGGRGGPTAGVGHPWYSRSICCRASSSAAQAAWIMRSAPSEVGDCRARARFLSSSNPWAAAWSRNRKRWS